MKRTKRLLALVLAMMMAFAMLAMPAAAHGDEDEGIMPLGITRRCTEPGCSGTVSRYSTLDRVLVNGVCPECGKMDKYYKVYQCEREGCNTCSFDREISRVYLYTTCTH